MEFKIDCIRFACQLAVHGEASEKVLCAVLLKRRTSVSNEWIAERLAMGRPASMSQQVNRMRGDPRAARSLKEHEQALKPKH